MLPALANQKMWFEVEQAIDAGWSVNSVLKVNGSAWRVSSFRLFPSRSTAAPRFILPPVGGRRESQKCCWNTVVMSTSSTKQA